SSAHGVLGRGRAVAPGPGGAAAGGGPLVRGGRGAFSGPHPRRPADLGDARALAARVADAQRARVMAHIPAKDPALADVAWEQIAAAVDALVVAEHEAQSAQSAEGLTTDYELEESLACTPADPSGGGAVSVAGRPDRAEFQRCGGRVVAVRVVDYKMSRSRTAYARRLDPERDLLKTGFQIPVYLLGALEWLGDAADDAKLDGGYLLLRADEPRLLREFTREDLGRAAERIRELVARARAG